MLHLFFSKKMYHKASIDKIALVIIEYNVARVNFFSHNYRKIENGKE